MTGKLAGKVAIITGSTSGIGRATAELFAQEGARVVVSGRRVELGRAVVAGILEGGGDASFISCDVSKSDQIRTLIESTVDTCGGLDILMNNAYSGKWRGVVDLPEEDWDSAMEVNIKAPYLACKYGIPHMIARGGGAIINTSSVHGILAASGMASYETAKAALINLTRQMAVDYGHQGIRVNAICPGWIIVNRDPADVSPARLREAETIYPIGRPGYPIDIARAALFLASEDASFITGHALMVDGGLTIQLQDSLAHRIQAALAETGGQW